MNFLSCMKKFKRSTEIDLPTHGLVVFGGRPGMGLTKGSLKVAAMHSLKRQGTFISFQSTKPIIQKRLASIRHFKPEILEVNVEFPWYYRSIVQDLRPLAREKEFLVIDDLDAFLGEQWYISLDERNQLIHDLRELAIEEFCCIVLNCKVSKTAELQSGFKIPRLQDFHWSRNLIHEADQVYAIHRPAYYGIIMDEEGRPIPDELHWWCLKGIDTVKNRKESNRK